MQPEDARGLPIYAKGWANKYAPGGAKRLRVTSDDTSGKAVDSAVNKVLEFADN